MSDPELATEVVAERDVMSLFAPLAAAARLVRASAAVVAPVPPLLTVIVEAFHVPVVMVPRVVTLALPEVDRKSVLGMALVNPPVPFPLRIPVPEVGGA